MTAGQESVYPAALDDSAVFVANAGTDPFDPIAQPLIARGRRALPLTKPTDSLNFVLGMGRYDLVAGTSGNQAVVWQLGAAQFLPPVASLFQGAAHDANSAELVVGTLVNDLTGNQLAVAWPPPYADGFALPLAPGTSGSAAFTLNEQGQIGGAVTGGAFSFEGARWDDPAQPPATIGVLPGGINSEILALNELGDAAGRSSFPDFSVIAIIHVRATNALIPLGTLAGNFSTALDVDDAGRAVGTSSAAGGVAHAFLWHDGQLHDLNDLLPPAIPSLLYLSRAVAIDAQGRIAAEALVQTPTGTFSRMALLVPMP